MIGFSFNCTGCEACVNSCPKSAISLRRAENGHYYPTIDSARCVHCDLCETHCAIFKKPKLALPKAFFLFQSSETSILNRSSSGGFATELAKVALQRGMKVYGVVWDPFTKKAIHTQITTDNLTKAAKSKYVKAMMGTLYSDIERDLKQGEQVLTFGLPCENFALRERFKNYDDSIVFVDLFCGGSVAPFFLEKYDSCIEKKSKKKVVSIDFRSKRFGSSVLCTEAFFSDGSSKVLNGRRNGYILLLGSRFVRPSCHNCQMGYTKSQADLRIGDLFGKVNRGKGTSTVLVYSKKPLMSELITLVGQRGVTKEQSISQIEQLTVCRSKSGFHLFDQEAYKESCEFYKTCLQEKTLWKPIKKFIIREMPFRKKVYLFLPYLLKKVVSK